MKFHIEDTAKMFGCGVLFGTAGIKILRSRDAKTLYTHVTAAVLRAKDCVMQTADDIRCDCEDIYARSKEHQRPPRRGRGQRQSSKRPRQSNEMQNSQRN